MKYSRLVLLTASSESTVLHKQVARYLTSSLVFSFWYMCKSQYLQISNTPFPWLTPSSSKLQSKLKQTNVLHYVFM